eukprot:scaffold103397_cov66-Phaeocystis_antarctica.AAC.7
MDPSSSAPASVGAESSAFAAGGISATARCSRRSMRTSQPGARVSVCAALLISAWIRGKRSSSTLQNCSTSGTLDSSSGPHTSSRWPHSPNPDASW